MEPVHYALDLALEAFVEMPDYQLMVCGRIHETKDFKDLYYKELFETPNINTIGGVDVDSQQFREITDHALECFTRPFQRAEFRQL